MKNFDAYMTSVGRMVIIISSVILVTSLFFFSKEKIKGTQIFKPTVIPTPIVNTSPTVTSQKFDLKGPLKCLYSADSATISAQLKDKKALVVRREKTLTTNYLVSGDCFYMWSSAQGKKYCNISQYVSILDTLSNIGLLDAGSVLGNLSKFGVTKSNLPSEDFIAAVTKTCKKEEVADTVFAVPSSVTFTTATLEK